MGDTPGYGGSGGTSEALRKKKAEISKAQADLAAMEHELEILVAVEAERARAALASMAAADGDNDLEDPYLRALSGPDWMAKHRQLGEEWGNSEEPGLVVLYLCDGIGGGAISAHRTHGINLKVRKAYSCEIDPLAREVLRVRHPEMVELGDMWGLTRSMIPEDVDLILAGFPCQDLSAMGFRRGLHGVDSINFFAVMRAFSIFRPKWFLLENVRSMMWYDRHEINRCLGPLVGQEELLPIELKADLISMGHRWRLYWTNIPFPQFIPPVSSHPSTAMQAAIKGGSALQMKCGAILTTNLCCSTKSKLKLSRVWDYKVNAMRPVCVSEVEAIMGYPPGYTDIDFAEAKKVQKVAAAVGSASPGSGQTPPGGEIPGTPPQNSVLVPPAPSPSMGADEAPPTSQQQQRQQRSLEANGTKQRQRSAPAKRLELADRGGEDSRSSGSRSHAVSVMGEAQKEPMVVDLSDISDSEDSGESSRGKRPRLGAETLERGRRVRGVSFREGPREEEGEGAERTSKLVSGRSGTLLVSEKAARIQGGDVAGCSKVKEESEWELSVGGGKRSDEVNRRMSGRVRRQVNYNEGVLAASQEAEEEVDEEWGSERRQRRARRRSAVMLAVVKKEKLWGVGGQRESNMRERWKLLGNTFDVMSVAYFQTPLLNPRVRAQGKPIAPPTVTGFKDSSVMNPGELWALYGKSNKPNYYAVIMRAEGQRFEPRLTEKGNVRKTSGINILVRYLDIAHDYNEDGDFPVRGTGGYVLMTKCTLQDSWTSFSHRVQGRSYRQLSNHKFFIHPGPGEVWVYLFPNNFEMHVLVESVHVDYDRVRHTEILASEEMEEDLREVEEKRVKRLERFAEKARGLSGEEAEKVTYCGWNGALDGEEKARVREEEWETEADFSEEWNVEGENERDVFHAKGWLLAHVALEEYMVLRGPEHQQILLPDLGRFSYRTPHHWMTARDRVRVEPQGKFRTSREVEERDDSSGEDLLADDD